MRVDLLPTNIPPGIPHAGDSLPVRISLPWQYDYHR